MVHRNILVLAFGLAFGCGATNTVELVESVPRETTLDRPEVPNAPDVWLDMVARATRTIDLAEFYVSDAPGSKMHAVLEAIERAAARGVHVRLLVDATFYAKYPEVPDAWSRRPNVEVRRLDLKPGVLHAKYFVVDGREAYVGSQNFDWRSLEHIVEMGARVRAPHVVGAIEAIFGADWDAAAGKPFRLDVARASDGPIALYASPKKLVPESLWDLPHLLAWIGEAKKTLRIQTMTYKTKSRDGSAFRELDDAVRAAAARGVAVELLVATWGEKDEAIAALARVPHVTVRVLDIPKFSGGDIPFARVTHAKFAVFDDARAWLGTSNWEGDYFYASRNLSLFFGGSLDGDPTARELGRVFDDEWRSAYARPPQPGTRFRVGDSVVYRYTGLFTTEPVELRERIVAQEGNRLTIDVVTTRASEQRHWEQVVTDTPENERNGVVDEIYEHVGAERRKLANAGNADLMRLYAWTVLQPDGRAHDVGTEKATLAVGGKDLACERTFGENAWHGRKVRFESFDCPAFLWTHARARFWDPATGEDVLRADVVESGNPP